MILTLDNYYFLNSLMVFKTYHSKYENQAKVFDREFFISFYVKFSHSFESLSAI